MIFCSSSELLGHKIPVPFMCLMLYNETQAKARELHEIHFYFLTYRTNYRSSLLSIIKMNSLVKKLITNTQLGPNSSGIL